MTTLFLRAKRDYSTPLVKGVHCLVFAGAKFGGGYGCIGYEGKIIGAHVLAWRKRKGPIPVGLNVCHHCDNKPCIEELHLYLGTHKQNMADAVTRGRFKATNLRHSDVLVEKIRKARGKQVDIALRFGVTQGYVSQIKNRKQRT